MAIEISDVDELQAMENDLEADYDLVNDIDASDTETWNWDEDREVDNGFDPIGGLSNRFEGFLNGNGYEISRMHIDRYPNTNLGLFGNIGIDGRVTNVGLRKCWLYGKAGLGLLCGRNQGRIWKCWAEDQNPSRAEGVKGEPEVSGSTTYYAIIIGGLIGRNATPFGIKRGGKVWACYTKNVGVRAEGSIGGFAGLNEQFAKIWGCYSDGGAVIADRTYSGGFVGRNENDAEIKNCYSTMEVSSTSTRVGGLLGENANEAIVSKCYATGSVTGTSDVGGLIGAQSTNAKTEDSFYDKDTTGQTASAGGTGKTTAEMQDIDTYTDVTTTGLDDPWDMAELANHIDEIWGIDDGNDYPVLLNPQAPPFVANVYVRIAGEPVLCPLHVRVAGTTVESAVHVK